MGLPVGICDFAVILKHSLQNTSCVLSATKEFSLFDFTELPCRKWTLNENRNLDCALFIIWEVIGNNWWNSPNKIDTNNVCGTPHKKMYHGTLPMYHGTFSYGLHLQRFWSLWRKRVILVKISRFIYFCSTQLVTSDL